jgi:hypothetical protein
MVHPGFPQIGAIQATFLACCACLLCSAGDSLAPHDTCEENITQRYLVIYRPYQPMPVHASQYALVQY